MIKAIARQGERKLLLIALSPGNLKRLKDEPLDTFIKILGKDVGIEVDIYIFSGEEEEVVKWMKEKGFIGPRTKVNLVDD